MAPLVSILTGFDCISNIESTVKAMTFLNPFLDYPTQIYLGIENFKPKKFLRSSLSLEPQSSPPRNECRIGPSWKQKEL